MKIQARIKALSPVFVGSDEKASTISLPYLIHIPHDKKKLKINKEKLDEFIRCLTAFYRECDKSNFGKRSFSEIFRDRVYAALCSPNISQFFTSLSRKLKTNGDQFYKYTVKFALELSKTENMFLLQWARENIDIFVHYAIYRNEGMEVDIDESFLELESDYLVPVIPGNTFRGIMRDLLMGYTIEKVYGENPHKVLTAKQYHTLFSGGMLTSQSGFVNIESKQQLRDDLPFLSILGAMIGNEDLPGKIKVGFGILDCWETNPENERLAFSFLKEYFMTRHDNYEGYVSEEETKEMGSVQMMYSVLAIERGAEFDWMLEYNFLTETERSFFDLMLYLLINRGKVGGSTRAGFGEIEIVPGDYAFDMDAADSFLDVNKDKIKQVLNDQFGVTKKEKKDAGTDSEGKAEDSAVE